MKRKLIDFDVFQRIEKDSLSASERELEEAAPIVAKALNLEGMSLHCFGSEDVLFETLDGGYVHANYSIKEGHVQFDNVELLVINEETEKAKSKEVIANMIDALVETDNKRAEAFFEEWMKLPVTKRVFREAKEMRVVPKRKDGKIIGYGKARWETKAKSKESSSDTAKRMRSKVKNNKKLSDSQKKFKANKRSKIKATIGEWSNLVNNVINYIDYREIGPVLKESVNRVDERGNIVSLRIPSIKLRNEAKLLQFDWKTLNTDVVVKRSNAKSISEDVNFVKAVEDLKTCNGMSDDAGLEVALENIVSKWPEVLYLTQDELAKQIAVALETAGASNYDDQVCDFMAEGILRTAHSAYVDRVAKVLKLSGGHVSESAEDAYASFKYIVDQYYTHLDESTRLEMQVFVDLYEALRTVHSLALEEKNDAVLAETESHLDELLPIIKREVEPSLDVAVSATEWLYDLVETNLEGSDWSVSNTPHITINGDHPDMAKKAKHSYTPASDFSGDWGDVAPASDGKSYKSGHADEMRNRSWGNIGGKGVYPDIDNPYTPEPFGDYKIKGEKHVDADSGLLGHWSSSDTWPSLQNRYVPQAVTPQSYKMKNGSETDLVVDK